MRNINLLTTKYFNNNLKQNIKQNINKILEKFNIEQKHFLKFYLFSFCMLILRIFPYFIWNFTIFIFPFLDSIKLLQQEEEQGDSCKKWVLFWSLFAISILIDDIVYLIIQFFPFYYLIKFLIFTWLGLPTFDGINYILENYFFDFINESKKFFFKTEINEKTINSDLEKYMNKNNTEAANANKVNN